MTEQLNSDKFACIVARILDDKLAKDISVLNISQVSSLADYFVICSAESSTQVKALTGNLKEKIKNLFQRLPNGEENDLKNRWNLLDYGDVVVHVLQKDERETYAIEKFWSHAFSVDEKTWMEQSEEYSEYNNNKVN
ncbi:MAG: ribosome silencing factor [Candidatus Gastranaerophilaceae bacterium]